MASFTQLHKRKRHDVRTCAVKGLQYSRSPSSTIRATHPRGTMRYSDVLASLDESVEPHRLIIDGYMKFYCHPQVPLSLGFDIVCLALCVSEWVYDCLSSLCYSTFISLIIRLSTHTRPQSGTEINNEWSFTSTTPHAFKTRTDANLLSILPLNS